MSLKTDIQGTMQDLLANDLGDALAVKADIQSVMQDVVGVDLLTEEISETVTYHSAAVSADETYDPETGTYV